MFLAVALHDALAPAGPQAARIATLWWIFFWVCVVVYMLTIGFLLHAIACGRRRAEPIADDIPSLKRAVTAAAVVSIGALFVLLGVSVATGSAIGNFAHDNPNQLEIEVTGHQWWWEVKYPDALNPSAAIVDANQIHIPINTAILLRIDTRDVIHSFWVPNLHGKRDLVPGRVNKFWIQADKPGVYRGQCAEYCGLQHAHMALTVVAEQREEFARWKSHMRDGAPTPVRPEEIRGQQVFLSVPCSKCHNVVGIDAYATLGPDLTHFRSRPTLAAGTLLNTRGNLAAWVRNAPAIKPGVQMPPVELTGAQLNDLLAYLETLR
jgi:cytochrome c oxidase subunit 2